MKIIATVLTTVQVSMDEFKTVPKSKVFEITEPCENILNWARKHVAKISFATIQISDNED